MDLRLFSDKVIDPAGEEGLVALRKKALVCVKCDLSACRTNVVFGEGNANQPPICFVGEAPGGVEDQTARPFVGPAGQLLDKIITAIGLTRDEVYIANALNCRPPGNRIPEKQELKQCYEYLVGQVRAVRPKTIVALGATAVAAFLGGQAKITALRGKWLEWEGYPLMPTYHPSYILRSSNSPEFVDLKKQVWSDMLQVLRKLGRAPPG